MKHLTAQPAVDELPAPFPAVIRKALAKDPRDRYQTVNEMIHDVFVVADIDQSVSSFEHASLTTLAAGAVRDLNATMPAKSPGTRLVIGARVNHDGVQIGGMRPGAKAVLGDGSSNVSQAPGAEVVQVSRVGGRWERFHRRFQGGAERIADRVDGTGIARQVAETAAAPRAAVEKVLTASLIALAGAVLFGFSGQSGGHGVRLGLAGFATVATIVQGVVLGCWLSFERLRTTSDWLPKFLIICIGGAGLLPAVAITEPVLRGDDDRWPLAILAALLLCDWVGRFYEGRKGQVSLGKAFNAGLFTFLAGAVLADASLGLAALAACGSLCLQVIAGIWPVTAATPLPASAGVRGRHQEQGQAGGPAGHAVAQDPAVVVRPTSPRITPPPIPGGAASAGDGASPTNAAERVARSPAVRAFWLASGVPCLVGGIVSFASAGMRAESDREFAIWLMAGASGVGGWLFCLLQSMRRWASGLWRGYLRWAIFFSGLVMSATGGIGAGLIAGGEDHRILPWIAVIVTGAACSLFVWLVPSPAPASSQVVSEEERIERRRRTGNWMLVGGGILFGVVGSMAAVMSSIQGLDDLLPVAVVPPGVLAIGLLIAGGSFLESARKEQRGKSRKAKLKLPLRYVFEVDGAARIGALMERHLAVTGYRMVEKTDLLWSFERGSGVAQFWQDDVRQWKTRLNIAAFELGGDLLRVSCFLNVEQRLFDVNKKQLEVLAGELEELRLVLGGREPSSSAPAEAARAV